MQHTCYLGSTEVDFNQRLLFSCCLPWLLQLSCSALPSHYPFLLFLTFLCCSSIFIVQFLYCLSCGAHCWNDGRVSRHVFHQKLLFQTKVVWMTPMSTLGFYFFTHMRGLVAFYWMMRIHVSISITPCRWGVLNWLLSQPRLMPLPCLGSLYCDFSVASSGGRVYFHSLSLCWTRDFSGQYDEAEKGFASSKPGNSSGCLRLPREYTWNG